MVGYSCQVLLGAELANGRFEQLFAELGLEHSSSNLRLPCPECRGRSHPASLHAISCASCSGRYNLQSQRTSTTRVIEESTLEDRRACCRLRCALTHYASSLESLAHGKQQAEVLRN